MRENRQFEATKSLPAARQAGETRNKFKLTDNKRFKCFKRKGIRFGVWRMPVWRGPSTKWDFFCKRADDSACVQPIERASLEFCPTPSSSNSMTNDDLVVNDELDYIPAFLAFPPRSRGNRAHTRDLRGDRQLSNQCSMPSLRFLATALTGKS